MSQPRIKKHVTPIDQPASLSNCEVEMVGPKKSTRFNISPSMAALMTKRSATAEKDKASAEAALKLHRASLESFQDLANTLAAEAGVTGNVDIRLGKDKDQDYIDFVELADKNQTPAAG